MLARPSAVFGYLQITVLTSYSLSTVCPSSRTVLSALAPAEYSALCSTILAVRSLLAVSHTCFSFVSRTCQDVTSERSSVVCCLPAIFPISSFSQIICPSRDPFPFANLEAWLVSPRTVCALSVALPSHHSAPRAAAARCP